MAVLSVCKRTSIKTSWTEISEEFSAILEKQVVLYPFQCNKAMLFCNSEEEAEWVARHKKIMVNLKDEVLLCRWEQKCNFHGKRKFVCFGGWIEIEGLPFNLWTNEIFKQIGDACGGYLETDYETENLLTLFAARIKVKSNEFGLIPEFVDVIGNFEAFYVRIHPSTLPSHYGNTKWKNASKEKKSVDAQTRISHSWEKLKAAVESSPTKIPAAATGKCSASDFKSIHMPRGLKDNKTEYQQKNPITFERLGSVELSPGWRKDLIKGDRSSIQKEKNVLENGRGTEVREKVDWNAQKFVDADMAGYTGTVAMGKNNKELRPLGVLKNTKCVGADTVGRSKSVETGLAVRDQFLQKNRRLSDGGLRSKNWAFLDFPIGTKFFKKFGPTNISGRGPRLLSTKCVEGIESSHEHSNQQMETVLQEQQLELLATEQALETDFSLEEGSHFEIGQSSRQPVLELDCDCAPAYIQSEEEDQEQAEDSEDCHHRKLTETSLNRTMLDYLISLMTQKR
ncbi:hypothetical protein M0R45_036644 [Rubus argutus]|uniref:DUF4283 domain-containing protein n=1 Tax=Rubus argutus TaxID=59490 RepID=A0AAW1W1U3_RUBAR